MSEIIIRSATPDDYEAIAKVWQAGWRSTQLTHLSNPPLDYYRERMPQELGKGWCLRVAQDGEAVCAMLAIHPASKQLDQLFVAPFHQHRGIGRSLLAFTRQHLPDEVWLRTASDNVRACQWFEREGFLLEKEEPHPVSGFMMRYYRWRK